MKLKELLKKSFDAGYDTSVMYNCGFGDAYEDFESFYKNEIEQLTLTDVGYCNCDESKQLEEDFEIKHLINDTYQVVGKESNTIWKQGTMDECNDWVML